jgi:hypothetical protein
VSADFAPVKARRKPSNFSSARIFVISAPRLNRRRKNPGI